MFPGKMSEEAAESTSKLPFASFNDSALPSIDRTRSTTRAAATKKARHLLMPGFRFPYPSSFSAGSLSTDQTDLLLVLHRLPSLSIVHPVLSLPVHRKVSSRTTILKHLTGRSIIWQLP
jgi:hypothetical protein